MDSNDIAMPGFLSKEPPALYAVIDIQLALALELGTEDAPARLKSQASRLIRRAPRSERAALESIIWASVSRREEQAWLYLRGDQHD